MVEYNITMKNVVIIIVDILLLIILSTIVGYFIVGDKLFDAIGIANPFTTNAEVVSEDYTLSQKELLSKSQAVVDAALREATLRAEEEARLNAKTTLMFTGDVMIGNQIQNYYNAGGIDALISEELRHTMNEADITMINNEFCFSTRGEKAADKQYTFRTDPSYVSILHELGVDIAGLANNHVLDFGKDALLDTFDLFDAEGICYTGAGRNLDDSAKLVTITVNNKKIGFLAASRVIPFGSWAAGSGIGVFSMYDPSELITRVTQAKEECDFVFVMVHWGIEHTDVLQPYQINNGHAIIDAGADGIIGMHSHCLQPIEYYNGKPIFYGMGNFIFSQTEGPALAVQLTIDADGVVSPQLFATRETEGRTYALSGDAASNVFTYLMSISDTVSIDADGYMSERISQ